MFSFSALKPHIVEVLEKHRDEELTERREKRKKTQEEEAAKKAEEEKNKTTANKDQEQMEVGKYWGLNNLSCQAHKVSLWYSIPMLCGPNV